MASAPTSSVALLAGPQLLGFFFGWALQGVLSVQIYIYHLWFPRDFLATKFLVYGIFVYEWIQTILVTQAAFQIDVFNYGNRSALTAFHNTWFSVTLMCAVISAVVQGYFCWRILILSRSKWLATTIGVFAISQMTVGVAGGIMLHVVDPTAAEESAVTPVISSWLAGAAFVDVVIAVCMTYFLLRAKSGIKRSDALIDRLARLVIESGTLTASVAIVDVICFTAFPQTLLHECPALVLAKLYSNTLLVSLNNRAVMRRAGQSGGAGSGTLTFSTFQSATMVKPQGDSAASASVHRQHAAHGAAQGEYHGPRDVHGITLEDTPAGEDGKRQEAYELTRLDSLATRRPGSAV